MGWIALILAGGIFLLFLFNRPKETLGCIGVSILVIVILVGWYQVKTTNDASREKAQQAEQERKASEEEAKIVAEERKVLITVAYSLKECGAKLPLRVTIANKSKEVLLKAAWSYEIYQVGFSSQLAGADRFSTDRIVHPGEDFSLCTALPKPNDNLKKSIPLSELEYRIANCDLTFKDLRRKRTIDDFF